MKLRIGFLFNHYIPHQVPHAVPYAFELSRRFPYEVIIACSTQEEMNLAKAIGALYPGHRCTFHRLTVPWYYPLIDPIVSKRRFKRKKFILSHNLNFFKGLAALVAPERNCVNLRTKHGLKDLILIHTRHGAGDRDGGFDERLLAFDFLLLPGQKLVDRIRSLGFLQEGRFVLSGYTKFEVTQGLKKEIPRLFNNDNPIVVYNPHFEKFQSSWQPMGLKVLEYFFHNREYNLIFAPHVVLFKRRKRHGAFLPLKFCHAPNIYIDLGSSASIDMTYMLAADIYLGDVSSQVYEFLLRPRPCIFLNGHQVNWQCNPSYHHWRLGQVVETIVPGLSEALKQAFVTHRQYLDIQRHTFASTFYSDPETTAAERGASAIADFLNARFFGQRGGYPVNSYDGYCLR